MSDLAASPVPLARAHDECRASPSRCRTVGAHGLDARHGLCGPCEEDVPSVLRALPHDYRELSTYLLDQPVAASGPAVTFSRERTTPLNGTADDLQGKVVHLACWLQDAVADLAGVRYAPGPPSPLDRLTAAVQLLAEYPTALLVLPAEPYRHDPLDRPTDLDGVAAYLRLDRLHQAVRMMAGRAELIHRLPGRCMDCGRVETLRRKNGLDKVVCVVCKAELSLDQYDGYVGMFNPLAMAAANAAVAAAEAEREAARKAAEEAAAEAVAA